jgi:hypothetical protein
MVRKLIPLVLIAAFAMATGLYAQDIAVEGVNDGLTLHGLVLFVHQLLFVFWLGPDIAVYMWSGKIIDPNLSPAARLSAAKILGVIDLIPRVCMSLMLTVGGILTEFVGVPHPTWQMIGIVLLGPFWLTMVLVVYFKEGTDFGRQAARFDFYFRWVLMFAMIVSVIWATSTGRLDAAPWVAGKLWLFIAILFFGIMLRIQFRPFGPALVKMATEGPSDEGNATMSRSVARTKPWVLALWACLFMEAFLGVVQPWSPDQTPDETVTSGMQRDFSG